VTPFALDGRTDRPIFTRSAQMDGNAWIVRFAEQLGVDAPGQTLVDELLALAGDAAHASERIAAPIACYLVGIAGLDAASARRLAAEIA
jgi:hypothetical protein